MSDLFAGLVRWIVEVIYSLGYLGLAALVALENLIPPIPSEVILPLAGFLVSQGRFSFVPALVASTAGSVAGALVLYGIGRRLGEERVRRLVRRFGRFLLLDESDLDKARGWFERYGREAVFIGRLVPGVRSLISVPAGIARMPIWRFIVYTLAGSTLWNGVLIGLGWVLGSQWAMVRDYAQVFQYVVLAAVAGGIVWYLWRRLRTRKH